MEEGKKGGGLIFKIFNLISLIFDCIYRVLCEYSKAVLVVIVFVVSAQVFSRKFLGRSIRWSEEVALLLMVWMAFISMAIGVEKGLHISISMFFDKFPKPVRLVISKATDVLMIVFGCAMMNYGMALIRTTAKSTLPATKWPSCTLYVMIPVSGLFIVYYSLIEMLGLQKFKHKNVIGNHI
ncbi:TRAP transporter small permease [Clostridium sp. Marseille-P2415]|uniref:TRAP transporter small permease n=1 Tax=Clostridium sp. Marseille-P2415 TaxID=1805471 RepID=UPI0009887849|nr:TRAP transporter small permease [Clostridium sp. Marseille-P2415]